MKLRWIQSVVVMSVALQAAAVQVNEVSQYGITWTFSEPVEAGQFVTGDWWVVGPVEVKTVSPQPGPTGAAEEVNQRSRYGTKALRSDSRMRNGSMIVTGPVYSESDPTGFVNQGYDSRPTNYDESRSVTFPCRLEVNRSLISTISSEKIEAGMLATPDVLGQYSLYLNRKPVSPLVLESAAVLTCLAEAPPADAFRPSYAGTDKPIYRTSQIQWSLLPNVPDCSSSSEWTMMNRFFERPWIDHINSWLIQHTAPGLNGPHYGREFARLSGMASLMLLQDAPQKTKEHLMIRYLQLGIDLSGLAQCGRQWAADGGHWQGRRWPILFAGLVLDAPGLCDFPPVDLSRKVYPRYFAAASDAVPVPTTLFQEDMGWYAGAGGDGQTLLWQIVNHSGPKPPHQETPRGEMNKLQRLHEDYYLNNVGGMSAVALSVQLMGARALWDNEAFFDHHNWYMTEAETPDSNQLKSGWKLFDPYVEKMWECCYGLIPEQPKGTRSLKWIWKDGQTGCWEVDTEKDVDEK